MKAILIKAGKFLIELLPYIVTGIIEVILTKKAAAKQNQQLLEVAKEQAAQTAQEAALQYFRGLN